ncbi:hypothetical protein BDY19DRAFT_974061 [Irpex rosettiformis]|uniref:Uncharacterized protein n=1 Tax=Irpex rosettiformis TaxID=378272 RepID=A0ACB8TPZ1_9APHY|nr:hypothetical protein BDY19DRAFT_974061 [Irpex rosettiformis]
MPPIRLGVIGLSARGWAAAGLIPPLLDPALSDKYTITAIATRSKASAQASVARYSDLTGHNIKGYHGEDGAIDIANDPDVDLVVVSVKVPDHYNAAKPAIEAGKDIFLEWSPTRNLEEILELAEIAEAKGVRTIVGAQSSQGATTRTVKGLVESGKIGKVISTNASLILPRETGLGGKTAIQQIAYALDNNSGATLLTMPVGHYLTNLSHVLGNIREVSATSAIFYPDVQIIDASGNPTGETIKKTSPDQIVITGILGGEHDGAIVTIHAQSGPSAARFLWFIDGEDGTIEVRNRLENGPFGVFATSNEMQVLLNNVEVELDRREEDRLGNAGKAWLEYAKGNEGEYQTLDHSVAVWRVLDAALRSIALGGQKVPVISA